MKLKVRVIPNARKAEFGGYRDGSLVLRINAPAIDGKANRAALAFLAEQIGVKPNAISLISGEKSRHKIFEIVGLEASDVERRLAASPARR
ncbi:MAG TPA: DUF167 domain-containing protein [Terriglobia bacterium]|nr:DUF167 domain-containing protein [Terriglobia bacterium]